MNHIYIKLYCRISSLSSHLLLIFLFFGEMVIGSVSIHAGNLEECKQFFWTIYSFIYFLGTYLKPHVSILYLHAND